MGEDYGDRSQCWTTDYLDHNVWPPWSSLPLVSCGFPPLDFPLTVTYTKRAVLVMRCFRQLHRIVIDNEDSRICNTNLINGTGIVPGHGISCMWETYRWEQAVLQNLSRCLSYTWRFVSVLLAWIKFNLHEHTRSRYSTSRYLLIQFSTRDLVAAGTSLSKGKS